MPGIMDTASWITSCIFPRNGFLSLTLDSEKNAISQKNWIFPLKMKSGSDWSARHSRAAGFMPSGLAVTLPMAWSCFCGQPWPFKWSLVLSCHKFKRKGISGISRSGLPREKTGAALKNPVLPHDPVSVQESAQNPDYPWETIVPAEGSKGPVYAERKFIRCFSCQKDQNRNYVKPGDEVWLYLRKYADGEVKCFTSNAPPVLPVQELDRAAALRWPIEQCFEECRSSLGMGHYECRSYQGWHRHMLFVMTAHLFTTQARDLLKKINPNWQCRWQ